MEPPGTTIYIWKLINTDKGEHKVHSRDEYIVIFLDSDLSYHINGV